MNAGAGLERRMRLYGRYATLATEQEAALARDDFGRFEEIATLRDEIRRELDGVVAVGEELEIRRRILAPALATERRIQRRLGEMRADVALQLRDLGHRAVATHRYARTLDAGATSGLDLRL